MRNDVENSVRQQATQTVNAADVIHKNTVQMQANRHESERVWAVVCQLTVIVWSCVHPALGLEGGCAVWEAAFNAESWRPANDMDSNTQRQPDNQTSMISTLLFARWIHP